MRLQRTAVLPMLVLVLAAGPAAAQDAPHWTGAQLTIDCTTPCHLTHQAGGEILTSDSNVNLCTACHNPAGIAAGMPINATDAAVPGLRGSSHAFGVDAVHATYGTQVPASTVMANRIMNGKVVCSTCHNQHAAEAVTGGTLHLSEPSKITPYGSTGSVTLGASATFSGSEGTWYEVKITQAGTLATARFQWQKYDAAGGWSGWSANTNLGSDVALDSGITVSFSAGDYVLDEQWELYAAWPFLRQPLDSGDNAAGDRFCRDCHSSWVMTHSAVESWDNTYKSHPVGVGLDANGEGYDRIAGGVPQILDGNGGVQGGAGADSNPSNDLQLDGGNLVQCLSCHGVHDADSNTLTVDGP